MTDLKNNKVFQVSKWIVLCGLVILLITLFISSSSSKVDHSDTVWDTRTTIGNIDAKNYYIQYTDLACPYCTVFSREIMNHGDEFKKDYIEDKDILYEVRATDMIYEYSDAHAQMSRDSAEAIYCATEEDKFWDYYHAALAALWNDYQSNGIGVSKTSEPITDLPANYWLNIGKFIGLEDQFAECLSSHKMVSKVQENTEKAARLTNGLPYFKFNKFATGGFDNNWGWDYVKKYLDSGLKK